MKLTFHEPFWSGSRASDCLADHNYRLYESFRGNPYKYKDPLGKDNNHEAAMFEYMFRPLWEYLTGGEGAKDAKEAGKQVYEYTPLSAPEHIYKASGIVCEDPSDLFA